MCSVVNEFVSPFIRFGDIGHKTHPGHDIHPSRSSDVSGHVTIWYPEYPDIISDRCFVITEFVSRSPAIFRIMGHKPIRLLSTRPWPFKVTWRSWSVTIQFAICDFLLVIHGTERASITNRFWDIRLQIACMSPVLCYCHCACAVSCDLYPYVKCKYIF